MKEPSFKPNSRLPLKLIRNISMLGLPLLLAACGGSGTGDDDGGTPPPNPVFSTTYTLKESEAGPDTWFSTGFINTIDVEQRSSRISFFEPFPVPESGTVTIEYDANDIEAEFSIATFFSFYLPQTDGQPANPTIDNPNASVKVAGFARILKMDGSDIPNSFIDSHGAELRHLYSQSGTEVSSRIIPVYADDAVTVRASYASGPTDYDVDLNLAEGWNLVYTEFQPHEDRSTTIYRSQTPSGTTRVHTHRRLTWMGDTMPDYDVRFLSVFSKSSVRTQDPDVYLDSPYSYDGDRASVYVRAWLPPDIAAATMVPFKNMFGESYTGTISGADDLSVTIAEILSIGSDGHWESTADSNGRARFLTESGGHPVHLIYSNRRAQVEFTGVELSDSGTMLRTDAGGLRLQYGWNLVAEIPDPTEPDTLTWAHIFQNDVSIIAEQD